MTATARKSIQVKNAIVVALEDDESDGLRFKLPVFIEYFTYHVFRPIVAPILWISNERILLRNLFFSLPKLEGSISEKYAMFQCQNH